MTFRRVDEIQAGLVQYLKSKTTIVDLIYNDDSEQIKEYDWQGTIAFYPCIRVRILNNYPMQQCGGSTFNASILAFSEEASSREANQIAGIIASVIRDKGYKSNGVAFYTKINDLVPAIRQDVRTWRSEVLISGIAS